MEKLTEILSKIIQEAKGKQLDEYNGSLFEEMRLFQEFADPNFAYPYKEVKPNVWEFQDKYGNMIGCHFLPLSKYHFGIKGNAEFWNSRQLRNEQEFYKGLF